MTRNYGVLFDLDGTLLDSGDASYIATCSIFIAGGVIAPSRDEYHKWMAPLFERFYHERGVAFPTEEIWEMYHALSNHREAELFPDVLGVLRALRARGIPIGLVSYQKLDVIKLVCVRTGIAELLPFVAGHLAEKHSATRAFCTEQKLRPERVCVVGDFGADIRDAKRAGAVAIGITRSTVSPSVFWECGADYVIEGLSDLTRLVETHFA